MRNNILFFNSTEPSFHTDIHPLLKLDPDKYHELALLNIDMYNSIPNISSKNNKMSYEYQLSRYDTRGVQ